MKKVLSFFILMLLPMVAGAYDAKIDGIYYDFDTNAKTATVTYVYRYDNKNAYTGNVIIPATVNYKGETYDVTSIGSFAFVRCTGLTSVTIPNSVTSIEGSAFSYCSGLTSITVEDGNTVFDSRDNCNAIIKTENNELISGCRNTVIPNSVTSIGVGAFNGCSSLTSVTIPNSVTSIGSEAFYGCSGLSSVTIPNSVTSIGNSAFQGCSDLTSITIPNSVTSIGYDAFVGCYFQYSSFINNSTLTHSSYWGATLVDKETEDGLLIKDNTIVKCRLWATSVTIPNSVTSIEGSAFSYCSGLTSITVEDGNTVFDSRDNCNAIIKTENNELISGCRNTVIPNSVTSIGVGAFNGCSSLTSVTIPNSVTSIEGSAFHNCSGLTSVTIGSGVTSIGAGAFYNCSGLTSVTIPNCVTSMGRSAFCGCSGLTSVTIGNGVTSIGESTFSGCSGLTSVTMGNSVTSIGERAFSGCSSLTSVTIPNSVTSIGARAFQGCSGLTSVTIGNSVTSIGADVFMGCTSLMTVKSYIKEPYNISKFENETYRQGTLYVPIGTKDLYIRYDGWREFLKIEEMTAEPGPNGECATPRIYVVGKKFVYECETPGAEFESILSTEEERSKGNEFVMENKTIKYTLTVYATAEGYDRSQPATISFVIDRNDVNQDGAVDVADISTIISTMAEKARMQEETEEE